MRFVISVYGDAYMPLLAVCLDSLSREHPDDRVTVVWDQISNLEIKLLQTRFQAVDFQRQEHNIFHEDVRKRIPLKLRFWAEITNRIREKIICFLDSDSLVYKNIAPYVQGDFDLIFTWKNEAFPLNVGVVIVKNSQRIRKLLELWRKRTEDIVNDEELLKSACIRHGAADQQSLADLIGTSDYENDITRSFEFGSIHFRSVPCDELNQSNIVPVENSTSIFHYKTGWHPILLKEEGFTANRPKKTALDLLYLWERRYALYNQNLMNAFVVKAASQHKDIIERSTFRYWQTGHLLSKMLAVLAVIKELDIQIIIEVGRKSGNGQNILEQGFKDDNVTIIRVDPKRDEGAGAVKASSRGCLNAQLLFGDIHRKVAEIGEKYENKRTAIVFNQPTGTDVFQLFSEILTTNENIMAGFFHDCGQFSSRTTNPPRREIYKYYDRLFFTDNNEYVHRFKFLDEHVKASEQSVNEKNLCPYRKGGHQIGRFAGAMAVVIPTKRDKERWRKISGNYPINKWRNSLFLKFKSFAKKNIRNGFGLNV